MNAKIENVMAALAEIQEDTKILHPLGKTVKSRRGRGEAVFTIEGYPEAPTSIEMAQAVLGRSKNGKVQVLKMDTFSDASTAEVDAENKPAETEV